MLLATILSLVLFLQKETACSSNEVIVQEDSAIKLFARGRGFLQRLSATRKKEINERIVNCMVAIRGKISWKIIRANFLRYLFLHEQEERQIFNLKTNLFLQQWTARDKRGHRIFVDIFDRVSFPILTFNVYDKCPPGY